MSVRITFAIILVAGCAAGGYYWWPAAVAVAPVCVWWIFFKMTAPEPKWSGLAELKTGTVKWLPRGGRTMWLNGDWELRTGPGGAWRPVKTPSDLATVRGFSELKRLEFRRKFKLDAFFADGRIFIGVLGAGGRVSVTLNGKQAARKMYGFLPFEVEVGGLARTDSENEIVIRVDRLRGRRAPQSDMCLGPRFAVGLFRDVYIQERKKVFIQSVRVESDAETGGSRLIVSLNGDTAEPVAVSGTIEDSSARAIMSFEKVVDGGRAEAGFRIPPDSKKIERWSRRRPVLYKVKVKIACGDISDTAERTFGVRRVELTRLGVVVNGEHQRLFGVKKAEHFPPYGAAFPGWAMKRDVELAAEAKLNLLMPVGFPFHPAFLDHCDKQGIYVIQDIPLGEMLECMHSADEVADVLENAIKDAATHPSVLFWRLAGANGAARSDKLKELISRFAARNSIVLSPDAAVELGIQQESPDIVDAAVDVTRDEELDGCFSPVRENSAALCVMDMLDGSGGALGRGASEGLRAAAVEKALTSVSHTGAAGVVLGHMFGWGLQTGLMSVTRKKKLSSDIVRNYLESGNAGAINRPAVPSLIALKVFPCLLAFGFLCLLYLMPATRSLANYPQLFLALVPLRFLLALKVLSFAAVVISAEYFIETNPGYVFALAPRMRFPLFMRLASGRAYRMAIIFAMLAWLQGAGFTILYLTSGAGRQVLVGAIALASFFDLVFIAMPLLKADMLAVLFSAALLQGIYLAQFTGPCPAAVFTAVAYVPVFAVFAWLRAMNNME